MKNMFKISKITFLFVFVSLIFAACGKETVELNSNSSTSANSSLTKSLNNDCNPYDEYGELHNLGVDYIMSFKDEILAQTQDEIEIRALVAQKTEEFLATIEPEASNYGTATIEWESYYELDLTNYVPILEAADLTDYEKQILAAYFEQLTDFDLTSEEGLAGFIDLAENLECSLLSDDQIIHQDGVFTPLTVAKNSALYWTNSDQVEQTNGLFGFILGDIFGAIYGYSGKAKRRGRRVLGFAAAFSAAGAISPV